MEEFPALEGEFAATDEVGEDGLRRGEEGGEERGFVFGTRCVLNVRMRWDAGGPRWGPSFMLAFHADSDVLPEHVERVRNGEEVCCDKTESGYRFEL